MGVIVCSAAGAPVTFTRDRHPDAVGRRRRVVGQRAGRRVGQHEGTGRQLVGEQLPGLDRVGLAVAVAGHHWATGQAPQAGFLAWQVRRPWKISTWLSMVQSRLGNSAPIACSTLTGSVSAVQPNRRTSRPKCVSTVMPGTSNALPSTTLAVLRPTPGRVTRSSSRPGTSPSKRSTMAALSLITELVLARKKPVGRSTASISSRSAPASASAVGQRENSVGVTVLTMTSVVCAESTVATSSCSGVSKSSSQWA